MKKLFLSVLLFICFPIVGFSQNISVIDSLRKLQTYYSSQQKSTVNDSVTAMVMYELSREYWSSDLDTSMMYAEQLLKFATEINFNTGIGNAYNSLGVINWYKGDYQRSLIYNEKALDIRKKSGDIEGMANSYNNIGLVYNDQGNLPEGLKNYLQSLKLNESLDDKDGISQAYNNIATIYILQKNFDEALSNIKASLQIRLKIDDKWGLTECYSNLGLIYFEMSNYTDAMINYEKALKLREELGDQSGIAISYNNFGDTFLREGNFDKALASYMKALDINTKIGLKKSMADVMLNIGALYQKYNNLDKALYYESEALKISREIGAVDYLKNIYEKLSETSALLGNYKAAYEYHSLFQHMSDSLFNTDKTKEMVQLHMQYEFDKKEAKEHEKQIKKDAETAVEIKRQEIIRNSFIGGFAIVVIFSIVVFNQKSRISKEKKISDQERKKSDELLLNILPKETAMELKLNGSTRARNYDLVSVMFTDIKDFTRMCEVLTPDELVNEINECFSAFDKIIEKHSLEKIKTIGDSYMAAGGLPTPDNNHAERLVNAALEIQQFMKNYNGKKKEVEKPEFEIRIGIHTGPVVAGIVGIKKFSYDIWGDTVNIASRMESSGEVGRVNISCDTRELVKDLFQLEYRGRISVKSKGMFEMYFVQPL